MSAYTFPSLPEHVARELKRRAVTENEDIPAVIVETLERGLGLAEGVHSDLDFLIGSWEADPLFDEAVKPFEAIDGDQWQ